MKNSEPPTVGSVLARTLADRGIRPTEFARHADVKLSTISGLLSGYARVDGDTDKMLTAQLGTDPGYWLRVQADRWGWEKGRREPHPDATQAGLRKLLVKIARIDGERIDHAVKRIIEAVGEYRSFAYPVRNRDNDDSVTTVVSDMRRNARKFAQVIESAKGGTSRERNRILTWYGRLGLVKPIFLRHLDAPGGTLLNDLPKARKAAQATLREVMATPNREPNRDLRVLAAVVARVLGDELGVYPASSRHTHNANITQTRGGAAYSRVLEVVMVLAGEGSTDLEKWISAGLQLVDDPDIPL